MPAKNTTREYIEDGYYHIFNRGVEQRRIFQEAKDYQTFINYLKTYLTPLNLLLKEEPILRTNKIKGNLSEQIDLIAYCLMPNHFHLLIKQKTKNGISRLMHQAVTGYSMYFNKKYERVGSLFQGRFKAVRVDSDEYLLRLSRYIHQNPDQRGISLSDFPWSSYSAYVGTNTHDWLKPQSVLEYFNDSKKGFSYKDFVEGRKDSQHILPENLLLDA